MGVYEAIASKLHNAAVVHAAAEVSGLDLALLCAVVEKETLGKHVYGNDTGGVFSTPGAPDIEVTRANFTEYERRVLGGETPNGVGIMQITYAGAKLANGTRQGGYLRQAWELGYDLSNPYENVLFGTVILKGHLAAAGSNGALTEAAVKFVGTKYNGKAAYGDALWTTYQAWDARLKSATTPVVTASDVAAARELTSRLEAIHSGTGTGTQ